METQTKKPEVAETPASLQNLFEQTKDQRTGKSLEHGSTATPFSTFYWVALNNTLKPNEADKTKAEAQFADDIEWCMMNNGQYRKGKKDVMPWLWEGGFGSDKSSAEPISNMATKEWGVWEYWNVGIVSEGIIEFAEKSKWKFPHDPKTLIGRIYKLPVCFVYHINAQGKIDKVREYLDTSSLMAQFK